ncbi:hypothetical protein [Microtetraspora sp. NBRC 16547]|uniref:hypothetical protein n=1 Tax=Microtetraspora sp. NBRC 16547 TaxID=3030993 RepID=UPI0024A479C0|nr:hypothetical protein [Microtetraspora sp. NBRC 16547]GLW98505.1 hypothetical protein Misp02_25920 [Microtetraspora sp. NBRC 16547]
MSKRTRIITLLSGVLTATGTAALTAAPAHADTVGNLLGGLPLVGGLLSDRNIKTAVTPIRWDR